MSIIVIVVLIIHLFQYVLGLGRIDVIEDPFSTILNKIFGKMHEYWTNLIIFFL